MIGGWLAEWLKVLAAVRGNVPWWRSALVWAAALGALVLLLNAVGESPLVTVWVVPLLFAAGLLWAGVVIRAAYLGSEPFFVFITGCFAAALTGELLLRIALWIAGR